MVATVTKSANLNNKSSVGVFDNGSVRRSSSPSIHRNSSEEWVALSDEDFKAAVLERAKYARTEKRYSWRETNEHIEIKSEKVTPFKDETEMKEFAVSLLGEVWK